MEDREAKYFAQESHSCKVLKLVCELRWFGSTVCRFVFASIWPWILFLTYVGINKYFKHKF
jgi:hypothetical protein